MSERFNFGVLRRRAIAFIVAGVGAGLAVLLSLASALYEASQAKQLPQVKAGQVIDTGRWKVTVHRAVFGRQIPGMAASTQDRLAIELDLTNRSATTSNGYVRLIEVEAPPAGLQKPQFYLVRDSAIAFGLHPDMPERVMAVWAWPPGAQPPRQIRLKVGGQIHKKRDNLYGAPGWFDGPAVATVELAVEPRSSAMTEK